MNLKTSLFVPCQAYSLGFDCFSNIFLSELCLQHNHNFCTAHMTCETDKLHIFSFSLGNLLLEHWKSSGLSTEGHLLCLQFTFHLR